MVTYENRAKLGGRTVVEQARARLYLLLFVWFLLAVLKASAILGIIGILGLALGAPVAVVGIGLYVLETVLLALLTWRYVVYPRRVFASDSQVARLIEERSGLAPDTAVIAVELERNLEALTDPTSKALATTAVERALEQLSKLELSEVLPLRLLKVPFWKTVVAVGLVSVILWSSPAMRAELVRALILPSAAQGSQNGELAFMVGDITITYKYPDYTGIEPITIPGTTGDLEAVKGTVAELSISTDKPYSEAAIQLDDGTEISMQSQGEARFTGSLVIQKNGWYRFVLDSKLDATKRTIKVLPDVPPKVKIVSPPTRIEIRDIDSVDIVWRASDDYGLSKIQLVFDYDDGKGGREKRTVPIQTFKGDRSASGTYTWQLSGITLVPGDEVRYYLEAFDNDEISGAKPARSITHVLKVYSVKEHHEKVLADQERLFERLITLLADRLENPLPDQSKPTKQELNTRAKQVLGDVEDVLNRLSELLPKIEDDPMSPEYVVHFFQQMHDAWIKQRKEFSRQPALTEIERERKRYEMLPSEVASKTDIANLMKTYLKEPAPEWWQALYRQKERKLIEQAESDILKLMDIINKQRYDTLVAIAEEIKAGKEELARLLEEYKRTGDEALKRKILEKIAALKRKIEQLMQELSKLLSQMPEGFVNMDALRKNSGLDPLQKMEQELERGDLDSALAELDRFARDLERMITQLKEGSERLGEERFGEELAKLMQAVSELEDLVVRQGNVAKRTEQIAAAARKRLAEKLRERLRQLYDKLLAEAKKLVNQTSKLKPKADTFSGQHMEALKASSKHLLDLVKDKDLAFALEVARKALDSAETAERNLMWDTYSEREKAANRTTLKSAQMTLRRIISMLEEAMPQEDEVLSPQERSELERLAKTQRQLENDAAALQSKFNQLMNEVPGMPQSAPEGLEQARNSMSKARRSMQEHSSNPASQQARAAHRSLQDAMQALQQAAEQMRSGMGYAGMRKVPMRHRRDSQTGRGPISTEKVKIPSAETYRVPRELREDILKAMKEPSPKKYKTQNKTYYKGLVK